MDVYSEEIEFVDVTDEKIIKILINNIEFVKYAPFQQRLHKILCEMNN